MTATPLQMQSFQNQQKNYLYNSPNILPNNRNSVPSSPFLPGYLFGNSPQPGNSQTNSGGYSNNQRFVPTATSLGSGQGFSFSSPDLQKYQPQQTHPRHSLLKEGAPPTESLFTPLSGSPENLMETETTYREFQSPSELFLTPSNQSFNKSLFPTSHDFIPQSPAQIDPFYSQEDVINSDDIIDDTAVTVFGFPPAASSYILQEFSQYGTIEKYEMHNVGNWLHIKYQTRIQAKKALSKNGKQYAQRIMVGVLPCIKKQIGVDGDLTSASSLNISANTPNKLINNKPSTMRQLSSRNASGTSTTDFFSKDITPQKKDSVMSKALDYVFGW
ncbi:nucleoporin NUP35 [Hydra vulgaris]|uniref:Nucleoporin NUP35 n=1 Tax=Hydra vulgaris TaxID=6087 RepID=T2M941_HYDVU|nr:nucleoporin NUP35 [Hydra vulgaris]